MAGTPRAPVPAPRPAVASAPAQAYVLTLVLLVATTVIGALPARAATHRGPSAAARHWTGTWAAAASGTVPALPGASIRNVVHVGVGGTGGADQDLQPARHRPAPAGRRHRGAPGARPPGLPDAVPGSLRAATFGGARTLVVPPGRDHVTDPVALRVPAYSNLLITLHPPYSRRLRPGHLPPVRPPVRLRRPAGRPDRRPARLGVHDDRR
jgi:hypothetical protein